MEQGRPTIPESLPIAILKLSRSLYTSIALNSSRARGKILQRTLTLVTVLAIVGHFALGIDTVVELFVKKQLSRISELTLNTALPFAILAVLSDILVASALCGLLWRERSEFGDTNALINSLIIWAINRCLLTSVLAVVETIMFASRPKDLWFLAIDFVIGKLYANSLLATLNSRKSRKGRDDSRLSTTDVTTSFRMAPTISTDVEDSVARPVLRIISPRQGMSEDGRTSLVDLDSATPLKYRTPSLEGSVIL
ncbi:hypothetical protein NEOLEDRAFT_655553 [Neolentinus lepideus HHB14362 ss-1]|uniref:DUF6534 domain-containing protein n=1 Tax=Neolentinus lepideus HHB14362 ss-1 TaxID=1314782 RepID=A0A165QFF4_9AGAM|nr:hypothetical protein NEOLEDRAFT_655553 [Neolentinus lepideus HHB14362 ss-1]